MLAFIDGVIAFVLNDYVTAKEQEQESLTKIMEDIQRQRAEFHRQMKAYNDKQANIIEGECREVNSDENSCLQSSIVKLESNQTNL